MVVSLPRVHRNTPDTLIPAVDLSVNLSSLYIDRLIENESRF